MASALYAALSTTAAKSTRGGIGHYTSWTVNFLAKVSVAKLLSENIIGGRHDLRRKAIRLKMKII